MTDPTHESELRRAMCRMGVALYDRGLIAGTAGNLSARLASGRVLVTPRSVRKDRLDPADLVVVDPGEDREASLAAATTEWPVHRACYQADPDVGAAVHTHAPALTALGLAGEGRDGEKALTDALPELERALGPVRAVGFHASGSEALGRAVGRAVAEGGRVLLLRRHGVLTVGTDLDEAFDRTELAELSARAVLLARG